MSPDDGNAEPIPERQSLYERVGGEPWFLELINRFYDLVDNDPVLRPCTQRISPGLSSD